MKKTAAPSARLLAVVSSLCLVVAAEGRAATFIVDQVNVDRVDLLPGDGLCRWFPLPNTCTLRAAIQEANALANPPHVIVIPEGVRIVLTIPGRGEDAAATGDLDITQSMTVGGFDAGGPRPIVDANGIDRVFEVHEGIFFALKNLIVTGGDVSGETLPNFRGAGMQVGNDSLVDLDDCEFRGNRARQGAGLTIDQFATGFPSINTIDRCVFEDNRAVSGPAASAYASAILTGKAVVHLSDTTVARNRGGTSTVFIQEGAAQIQNTTVTHNDGDGVRMLGASGNLVNTTVAGNDGAGVEFATPGVPVTLRIVNSILSGNTDQDCRLLSGTFDLAGNRNLDSDGSCGLNLGLGDLPMGVPLLGALLHNGGPTETRVPGIGSPVIGAGEDATCAGTDQRGASRPLTAAGSAACDMGAVEVLPCDTELSRITLDDVPLGSGETVACHSITVGPNTEVVAGASHSLRTRGEVEFTDDFFVAVNASLTVVRDPEAGSSVSLP